MNNKFTNQDGNWSNNNIQFPRLIAELEAAGAFTEQVVQDLQESMDLMEEDVMEVIDRAQAAWDAEIAG